jgi:hypothetical protein
MATMRARVELRGSLSHTGMGRTFKKGSPQIITNPAEIEYYKSLGGFTVTVLPDVKVKGKPTAPPPPDGDDDGESAYTEAELNGMTKAQLTEVAEEYELELDDAMKKADMVAAILSAQG